MSQQLYQWEIHLVYSLENESPSDECYFVVAPDRETAIEKARTESVNRPPKVHVAGRDPAHYDSVSEGGDNA